MLDIVSAAANATPGLGRYPPFKREVQFLSMLKSQYFIVSVNNPFSFICSYKVIAIASAALDGFKNEARKMVIALVDMERAFVPPQHFIRLVQRRLGLLTTLCMCIHLATCAFYPLSAGEDFIESLLIFSMS